MIYLPNKDLQDALFFLNLFSVIFPLHILNRVTIHQELVTVYAAYGIYHIHSDCISNQSMQMHGKYHMLHIQ